MRSHLQAIRKQSGTENENNPKKTYNFQKAAAIYKVKG